MAKTTRYVSPGLKKVMERAKREPQTRLLSLAHLITPEALEAAYHELRGDAAVGVDGVTVEMYGEDLEENIKRLHERMKEGRYRHQPIRRVYIPKENGKLRPLGISATEDKIVQRALMTVLEAVYEQDFKENSYGFRPGRSAHDALRAVDQMRYRGGVTVILEADIQAFFDNIDRKELMRMLGERLDDKSLLRLVGKCLHVGILEGEVYAEPEKGTTQGSILSPLLGNIYLHHVLDRWFEEEVQPRMKGRSYLVRYADDFVIGFEHEEDAERVMKVIHKRFEKYGLTLHPDKTRLVRHPAQTHGRTGRGEPRAFDFLGFTHYWRQGRRGGWRPALKTRKGKLRKAMEAITGYCKRHRHEPIEKQHAALAARLNGFYNYFAVNDNIGTLGSLVSRVQKVWHKWLNRRSQRSRMNWDRFNDMLKEYPMPTPKVRVQLWGATP